MEFLQDYGLFLAKAATILLFVLIAIGALANLSRQQKLAAKGQIEVRKLNDSLEHLTHYMQGVVLSPDARRQQKRAAKRQQKTKAKGKAKPASRLFVLDFEGDLQASAVASLREEITAILAIGTRKDEVLVRLESPGGVVPGYGLAASQLGRVRAKGLALTVAVDKVAASGGYMMACIASRIIAAPFAVLGSIGVIAQLPNFHRLLKDQKVDVEVMKAGQYKRTLTVFGRNTDEDRQKFQHELDDLHSLFKDFVQEHRPALKLSEVATGEAWYGSRALDLNLVDALKTSDEYLIEQCAARDVFEVKFVAHKSRWERLMEKFVALATRPVATDPDPKRL